MTDVARLDAPRDLLPGSPAAVAHALGELAAIDPASGLQLGEAWMLDSLVEATSRFRELAAAGELSCLARYSRLDAYAPSGLEPSSRRLAEAAAARVPGARLVDSEVTAREPDPRLASCCASARELADRVALALAGLPEDDATDALRRAFLCATSAQGIGGQGSPEAQDAASAELESIAVALGAAREDDLDFPAAPELGARVPAKVLGEEGLCELRWSRSKGLGWAALDLRSALGFASLEVQGDAGTDDAFVAGHPSRPRVFRAGDMRPILHLREDRADWMRLRREIKLPVDPEASKGRLCRVGFELDLRVDRGEPSCEVVVRVVGLARGQRYRICIPVPFWPRPTRFSSAGERIELEGPFAARPARAPLVVEGKRRRLTIDGAGIRELAVLRCKNDFACAITLARPRKAGATVVRRYRLSWEKLNAARGS